MTSKLENATDVRDNWIAESEVDLQKYINIIMRWWHEVVAITVGCILLSIAVIFAIRLILPLRFVSSADVAIVRTVSDVNFDERFRTNPELLGENTANLSARRSALLGLATTGTIAQSVIDQLDSILDEEEKIPANLIEMVTAQSSGGESNSDLIQIKVIADSPEKSAAIATAWAHSYVREVNTIYGQVPDEVFASINAELTKAKEIYLTSQAELEKFISQARIDDLSSRIAVLQQQITQDVSLQQAILLQWQETQEKLNIANSLYTQISAGGSGAVRSSMAALQILKISTYGMSPAQLQIELRDIPQISENEMIADISGLINALEQQLLELEQQIADSNLESNKSDNTRMQILQTLRETKSELESETSKQLQLVQQRDLAWETYKTLSSKVTELNLTRAAASSEVRFGAAAVTPVDPERRIGLLTGVALSTIIGLLLSIFYIMLAEYSSTPTHIQSAKSEL